MSLNKPDFLLLAALLSSAALGGLIYAIDSGQPAMALFFGGGNKGIFWAQTVLTSPGLAMCIMAPIAGWIAQRIGCRAAFLMFTLLFSISGVAGLFVSDPRILVGTRLLTGAGSVGALIATAAYIGSYYPPDRRAQILGYQSSTGSVAGILAAFSGGFLTRWGGWRAPFAIYLLGLLPFILGLRGIREPGYSAHPSTGDERSPWSPKIVSLLIVNSVFAIFALNVTIQMPFLLVDKGFVDPVTFSLIGVVSSAVAAGLSPLFGRVYNYLGFSMLFSACLAIYSISHIIIGTASSLFMIGLGAGVSGIAGAFSSALFTAYALNTVPESARARVTGAIIGMLLLGQFLNPLAIAPMRQAFGMSNAFVLVGILAGIGAALTVCFERILRSTTDSPTLLSRVLKAK
jgi:MFS family permease